MIAHTCITIETQKFPVLDGEEIVLDIPDEYGYMDEELIEMIKASVEGYL